MSTYLDQALAYIFSWTSYLKKKWADYWKTPCRISWVKEHTQPLKPEYIGPKPEEDLSEEARRKAEHAKIFRDDEGVDDGTTSRDITPLGGGRF